MNQSNNVYAGKRSWEDGRRRDPRCNDVLPGAVQIVHANGILRSDPMTLTALAHRGDLLGLVPHDRLVSVVSSGPSVLYRTPESEVALTPEEVDRLVLRQLAPWQFSAICDAVGALWEMKAPWYDPATGVARGGLTDRYDARSNEAPQPFLMA